MKSLKQQAVFILIANELELQYDYKGVILDSKISAAADGKNTLRPEEYLSFTRCQASAYNAIIGAIEAGKITKAEVLAKYDTYK